eukprot:761911-Hanusia_phi.AAC.5
MISPRKLAPDTCSSPTGQTPRLLLSALVTNRNMPPRGILYPTSPAGHHRRSEVRRVEEQDLKVDEHPAEEDRDADPLQPSLAARSCCLVDTKARIDKPPLVVLVYMRQHAGLLWISHSQRIMETSHLHVSVHNTEQPCKRHHLDRSNSLKMQGGTARNGVPTEALASIPAFAMGRVALD